jgi:hypothetical protein
MWKSSPENEKNSKVHALRLVLVLSLSVARFLELHHKQLDKNR